jgi:hypothetical protein
MAETEELDLIPGRVLRQRFRRIAVAQIVLVLAMAFAFWLLQQLVEDVEAEQTARAMQVCNSTVTGRANQLVFTDVLITASTANGDSTDVQQRRIDAFQTGVEERLLGELPATCEGIMSLGEFRERTRLEARPPPDPGALP